MFLSTWILILHVSTGAAGQAPPVEIPFSYQQSCVDALAAFRAEAEKSRLAMAVTGACVRR